MLPSDPPSADAALLVGLSAAVSGMIGFGALMYLLMQPTVLPNAPYDGAGRAKPAPIIVRATPKTLPLDVEQSAIAVAARENEIQGLRPIVAHAETDILLAQAAAPKTTPKPAKPRRVIARAPHREPGHALASNWWGGGPSQPFGGFGSWYR